LSVFALLCESFINSVNIEATTNADIDVDQINKFFSEFNRTTYNLRESFSKVEESANEFEVQFKKCVVKDQRGRYFFVIPTEVNPEESGDQILRKANDLAEVLNKDYDNFKDLEKKRSDLLSVIKKQFPDSSYLESDLDVRRLQTYFRIKNRYGRYGDQLVI